MVLTNFQLRNRRRTASANVAAATTTMSGDPSLARLLADPSASTFLSLFHLLSVPTSGESREVLHQFALSTMMRRAMKLDFFDAVDGNVLTSSDPSHLISLACHYCKIVTDYCFEVAQVEDVSFSFNAVKAATGPLAALLVRCYHLIHQLKKEQPFAVSAASASNTSSFLSFVFSMLAGNSESRPHRIVRLRVIMNIPEVVNAPHCGKKLSIEPVFLKLIYEELQDIDCQRKLLDFLILSTDSAPPYAEMFDLCSKWAGVVPLRPEFLIPVCDLANSLIATDGDAATSDIRLLHAVYAFFAAAFEVEDEDESMENNQRQQRRASKRDGKGYTAPPKFAKSARISAAFVAISKSIAFVIAKIPGCALGHPSSPINCLCAAASTFLPAIFNPAVDCRNPSYEYIFGQICQSILELTTSGNVCRKLVYEPLEALASRVGSNVLTEGAWYCREDFLDGVRSFLIQSSMNLALKASYPPLYFRYYEEPVISELEVERNDARELLRTVAMTDEKALVFILSECQNSFASGVLDANACHVFSALAKPVTKVLAKVAGGESSALHFWLGCLREMLHCAVKLLTSLGMQSEGGVGSGSRPLPNSALSASIDILRVVCISISSHGLIFHSLLRKEPRFEAALQEIAALSVQFCVACCQKVREHPLMMDASADLNSLENLRGEFRGPGGEDHVGALALNRLCFEAQNADDKGPSPLAIIMAKCHTESLFDLHEILFLQESGDDAANAVLTSKSRRIILSSVCFLCTVSCDQRRLRLLVDSVRAASN